ncbi:MAG: hypothetical protein VX764_03590 [Planctomycetota bacterium]|nr:hypothetical protein [Planctomycetota bacterium]
MTDTDSNPAARSPRPLLRLGGCLLVLLLALGLGALIATWMVISGGLPTVPLIFPPLEEANIEVDWDLDRQRLEQGDELSLTPGTWNYLIGSIIDKQIDSGDLLQGSGARLHSQPDGSLQLMLSLGFPSDLEDVPWLLRGRFINVELVGNIRILDGEVATAKLDLYQWGSIYRGENLSEEESEQIALDLLDEIVPIIGEIRHLDYDGTQLKFSLAR